MPRYVTIGEMIRDAREAAKKTREFQALATALEPLSLPLDFMEYGPKTASLTLMFRDDSDRARFVAALERAGVKRRTE